MHTIFIEAKAISAAKRNQAEEYALCYKTKLNLAFVNWENLDFSGSLLLKGSWMLLLRSWLGLPWCFRQRINNLPGMQETWVQSLGGVFLPGEFHEQRNLADYSPWEGKESEMTEQRTHSLSEVNSYNNGLNRKLIALIYTSFEVSSLRWF